MWEMSVDYVNQCNGVDISAFSAALLPSLPTISKLLIWWFICIKQSLNQNLSKPNGCSIKSETRRDWPPAWMGGEPQPFPHQPDGFRFPCLGETTEVQISAI